MSIFPCSSVTKSIGDKTLVGGNFDSTNPYTQVKIVPGDKGKNGVIYLGYGENNLIAWSGGVNDKGLSLNFFSVPTIKVKRSLFKWDYKGFVHRKILEECETLEEAIKLIKKYERSYLSSVQLLIVDKYGESAIVEGNNIIFKKGNYQAVTNFYQSEIDDSNNSCKRYRNIVSNINSVDFSIDGFETILDSVKQKKYQRYPTLFSYILDLNQGVIYLYNFGDFTKRVMLDIGIELEKGYRIVDMSELLPNSDYEKFLNKYRMRKPKEIELLDNPKDYVGRYKFAYGEEADVFTKGDKLYIKTPYAQYELKPYKKDKFFFEVLEYKVLFKRDDKGRVFKLEAVHPSVKGFSGLRNS